MTIVVEPGDAWSGRKRLFSALEQALAVRIGARDSRDSTSVAARIAFGPEPGPSGLPTMVLPAGDEALLPDVVDVTFAPGGVLDRSLHRASLPHHAVQRFARTGGERDIDVLARLDGVPVWTRSQGGRVERAAVGLAELGPHETLRERLSPGRFLPLLPIVDFIRRVRASQWQGPVLRAAFVFDDPNLHRASYGYLDFRALAAEARRTGFHAALATIPLDSWYASRAAVELFRSHRRELSLLVHGNDHVRQELARPMEPARRRALLAQSLARVRRFEERHGVSVARVMAPPHGACSEEMAEEMIAAGFEALCVSRPYPWLDRPPQERVLAGWGPTDVVADGLPVISRFHLSADPSEIVLRAFLRQPIILYGHHDDVRPGLGVLTEAAEQVSRVGDASWMPLDEIVANSHESRIEDSRLRVRLHTRRSVIAVPEGVDEVAVECAAPPSELDRLVVTAAPRNAGLSGIEIGGQLDVRLERRRLGGDSAPASTRVRAWPYVRRTLTETRDRLLPLIDRS